MSVNEYEPPDPTAKDVKPTNYTIPQENNVLPKYTTQSASWGVWTCTKRPFEVTLNYNGYNGLPAVVCKNGGCDYCKRYGQLPYEHYCIEYQTKTDWVYTQVTSGITVTSEMDLKPDSLVPTAELKWYTPTYENAWEIGSGYGVNVEVTTNYFKSGNCTSNDYTRNNFV